jgi:hypothetical protein
MFHVKLHRLLFYIYLLILPLQIRIGYFVEQSYVSWYFNYHLAVFLYLSDLLLFLCFTFWIMFHTPKWHVIKHDRLFWLFLGFMVVILSTLHVKHILGWYGILKSLEGLFVLYYIKMEFTKRVDFGLSMAILAISSFLQAILGLAQFHMQHMVGLNWLGEYIAPLGTSGLATIDTLSGKFIRAYGTMPHPNVLAAFLILGLACALYFVSRESETRSKFIKLSRVIIISVFLLGIFLTFSRTAWFAAAILIICHIGFHIWKKEKGKILIAIAALIVSCGTIGIFYQDNFKARVSSADSRSVTDRYFFNQLGLNLIKTHPLFGVGVGNYVPALQERYQLEPWQYQPAHNIFIFTAAEIGLVGLGLFGLILINVFYRLKNISIDPLSGSVIVIGVLFLIMGQVDHYFVTIQQGRLMFATVLGLVAALPNLYETNPIEEIKTT